MRIQLQILASYFGPVKDMVEYQKEELPAELSIPIDDFKETVYDITFEEVERAADEAAGLPGGVASPVVAYSGQLGQANDANHKIRLQALQWAYDNTRQGTVTAPRASSTPAGRTTPPTPAELRQRSATTCPLC